MAGSTLVTGKGSWKSQGNDRTMIQPSIEENSVELTSDTSFIEPSTLLVGREEQFQQLQKLLENAWRGEGGFVVISGEAGTGKTHLVKYFAREAVHRGAMFVAESYQRVPSYEPYRPFWRIVKQLAKASDGEEETPFVADAPMPESSATDSGSLYSLQSGHRLAQQRLIKALLNAANDRVLIITLWDVHLAPLTAWQFIHFLSESLIEKRILLVLTLRQDGRETNPERIPVYAEVLQRMNREGLVQRIRLKRFSERDTRQLIFHLLKRTDFSSEFVKTLHQVTRGLPGKIIPILKHLQENGWIFKQEGVWFEKDGITRELLIDIINKEENVPNPEQLWLTLDETSKSILEYGALFEDAFTYQVLAEVLQKPRLQIVKELYKLQQKKLLLNLEEDAYLFKNPSLAHQIKQRIPLCRQREMHRQIGEAIKRNGSLSPEDRIPLMAYHFSKTDEYEEAFHYLMEAGNLAIQNFAFIKAREFFEGALRCLKHLDRDSLRETEIEIYFKMIWLNRALGERQKSLDYCSSLLAGLNDESHRGLRIRALIQQGLTFFQLNQWEKARECFMACFEDETETDPLDQAMAHYGLGNVYLEMSEYDLAEEHYQQALRLIEPLGSKLLKANLYNNLGIVENVRGNRLKAIALYSKCIPLYKSLGDNYGLARVYLNIGISYAHEHDWKQANTFYGKSLSVSDAMGLVPLKSITFLNRSQALTFLRNFQEAREYNVKAYRLLERLNDRLGLAEYYKNQGILEREEGHWESAREMLDKALQLFTSLKNKLGIAETEYELSTLYGQIDQREEQLNWLRKAQDHYSKLGLSAKVQQLEAELKRLLS
ncbi:MAG: tetratricopeptide repeat protein [Calditrichaeota bacterium]|nr:MAG: tetratricopeptide repeat protein [Calditrichota bacterium]